MTFTEQKPTVPGWYWWRRTENHTPILVAVILLDSIRCPDLEFIGLMDMRGLWSSRLVPCEEVERAWREGWKTAGGFEWEDDEYQASRARRVVDGKEGV